MRNSLGNSHPWQPRLKRLLRFLFKLLLQLDVEGLEKVPQTGPVILYISHANFLDPFIPAGLIDRPVAIMAKQELFSVPILGQIIRAYGAFPVRRSKGDITAYRHALEVLKSGGLLVIAPEGTRSGTGMLQRGKPGMIRLAQRSGALIQPMAIIGGLAFYSNLARLRRTPVTVRLGDPYLPVAKPGIPRHEEAQYLTDEAMYRLAALMPPETRGVYGDPALERPDTIARDVAHA